MSVQGLALPRIEVRFQIVKPILQAVARPPHHVQQESQQQAPVFAARISCSRLIGQSQAPTSDNTPHMTFDRLCGLRKNAPHRWDERLGRRKGNPVPASPYVKGVSVTGLQMSVNGLKVLKNQAFWAALFARAITAIAMPRFKRLRPRRRPNGANNNRLPHPVPVVWADRCDFASRLYVILLFAVGGGHWKRTLDSAM